LGVGIERGVRGGRRRNNELLAIDGYFLSLLTVTKCLPRVGVKIAE
jgi:hypothetical protein